MVNWCVRCRTALSDIEVEYETRKDKLYHIRYPILSGKKTDGRGAARCSYHTSGNHARRYGCGCQSKRFAL